MDRDYQPLLTTACFTLLALLLVVAVAYGIGVKVGESRAQVVYPPISYGQIPSGVPVWAVYEVDGSLHALSALKTNGVLRQFNIHGGPVDFEPIPNPDAWFTMSAAWAAWR